LLKFIHTAKSTTYVHTKKYDYNHKRTILQKRKLLNSLSCHSIMKSCKLLLMY